MDIHSSSSLRGRAEAQRVGAKLLFSKQCSPPRVYLFLSNKRPKLSLRHRRSEAMVRLFYVIFEI